MFVIIICLVNISRSEDFHRRFIIRAGVSVINTANEVHESAAEVMSEFRSVGKKLNRIENYGQKCLFSDCDACACVR